MTDASLKFVHLHTHSAYSLLEGALPIGRIAELCKADGMPAVAITDTVNLFGALEFSETMASAGVQPILGCSLPVDFDGRDKAGSTAGFGRNDSNHDTIVLLAKDETGYFNLLKLSSAAFLDSADTALPHVPAGMLENRGAGLICLTGGPGGPVDNAIVQNRSSLARTRLQHLQNLFGDRLYVELQRHGTADEREREAGLIDLAHDLKLPLVATNRPFFGKPDDFDAHDALICIAEGTVIANDDRRRLTKEHYFKSQGEMAELFSDLPEAIENTIEIARRCAFRPVEREPILPRVSGSSGDGEEADDLRRQARDGLRRRLEVHGHAPGFEEKDYFDRLEYELGVIVEMDFPGYFLIVADFISWAKEQDIPVGPGRGSGAGSVVAWALRITDLDPLRFNLIFERFLNPERISMPDFDVDFCQDRRDEVIAHVQRKYGERQVAQIITFGKLQARAVCRDVGRVLQMPYGKVDRLCKMIPNNPADPISLGKAIEGEPRLQEERKNDGQVAQLLEFGMRLEGLYRHASTHAAGVVIGDRPLEELVPLYRDPRSPMPVTQFNMNWVEKAGLVKFDFLGLKTLTVLQTGVKLLARRDISVDLSNLPLDQAEPYELLSRGETVGVFQLESSGMKDLIRRARPNNIEDVIALIALYRPGPMENIPKYLAAKSGEENPEFLHETITPIVADTYGVIIYQEQVLQIAQALSGYSLGEADILRKAMGKKIKSEMDRQKAKFVDGAVANGVEKSRAEFIFELVAKFAGYGFNRAHSACYGYIAYQTAWLKCNHPVEFLAASMTLDAGNTDKLHVFKQEADRMGVPIRPPSINHSESEFVVDDGRINYSLAALKNVGRGAIDHVVEIRRKDGPFTSVGNFARRVNPRIVNKRMLESLARAGAFDELEPNRRLVLESAELILSAAGRSAEDREAGQSNLFGVSDGEEEEDFLLPSGAEPWLPMRRLAEEFEAVGFYISGHPLDGYAKPLGMIGVESWADFADKVKNGGATAGRLAGTLTHRQERRSKTGNRFAFAGFSDPTGQFETIVFSDTLARLGDELNVGEAFVLVVEAEAEGDDVRLRLNRAEPIEKALTNVASGLRIFVADEAPLPSLSKRLTNGGKAPVRLVMMLGGAREVEISLGDVYTVTPEIKAAVKAIPGVLDVQDL